MSAELMKYREDLATPDSVIIRIVTEDGLTRAFVRFKSEGEDSTPHYPTEEIPVPEAIRLASNRREAGQPILVQLEEGAEWDDDWGDLRDDAE
ncbi:hypothetical protein [Rhizobium sp. L1K21]|uniref:hypothetical protein n=1 Tax=Rhizobium sp. L1K21 TaxID=2954933 RepID=UPI0020930CCB|nr:hypothetical protein [Rhizobium sp. L1K21]MCO6187818.1 hypothetical protein [Rhizobium sp. L1K21]